jgi:hypothetical protein
MTMNNVQNCVSYEKKNFLSENQDIQENGVWEDFQETVSSNVWRRDRRADPLV